MSAALPAALEAGGLDVRVLLPAYRPVLAATAAHRRELASFAATARLPAARLLEAPLPSGVPALARRLPGALRSRWRPLPGPCVRQRLARQRPALRAARAHRRPARRRVEPARLAAAGAPLQRLADGARARVPALRRRRPGGDRDVRPQPRVPGALPARDRSRGRAAAGRLLGRRRRVLRPPLVPQGGARVRRCDHDGQPDLRAGDPARAARVRACRACSPRARGDLHGILNGIDDARLGPGDRPALAQRYDAARPGGEARQQARAAGADRVARGPRRAALRLRRPAHPAEGRGPDRGGRAHRRGAGADRRPRLGRDASWRTRCGRSPTRIRARSRSGSASTSGSRT